MTNMITKQKIADELKQNGKYWVAFTGDSITSAEWVHPNWIEIVIYVLQAEMTDYLKDWKLSEWGIKGFNLGYDGATTKDILDRVEIINSVKPNLVIGLMGGNDPTLGISVEDSVENIKNVISSLDARVVWCNSTPAGEGSDKNLEYEPYAKAFMAIPESDNLQKIDMFNIYQQFPLTRIFTFKSEENPIEGLKQGDPDLQHPNQLGNAYIAKVILKEVFAIEFDPEKYWVATQAGEKLPGY